MKKFTRALKISNLTSFALKLLRREATSLPGKIAQKICPDFLIQCNNFIEHPRFGVTGTNGKTTTSTVLSEILLKSGKNILNNKLGANMPNGVVTALSKGLYENYKKTNQIKGEGAVLECDEAYFPAISGKFKFDYLLITNLFRDQLDRYGEMDIAREKIIKGIELNPDMKIILNADDPTLSEISEKFSDNKERFIYFGITSVDYTNYEKTSKSPTDAIYCPKCHEHIHYMKRYYAQLGDWFCRCGVKRKRPDVSARVIVQKDKCLLDVKYKTESHVFETNLTGLYNAYNVLGAITCALLAGVDFKTIETALSEYSPVFGRHQKVKLKNGGELTIHLIKNPVGASEVLRGLKNLQNSRMVVSVNDNYADGRDVSWLWDADFDALKDFSNVIYTTGTRSYDIALRIKHTGFNTKLLEVFDNTSKVTNSIENAIEELNENENLVVLVTYTGLLEINKNLKKLIKKYGS